MGDLSGAVTVSEVLLGTNEQGMITETVSTDSLPYLEVTLEKGLFGYEGVRVVLESVSDTEHFQAIAQDTSSSYWNIVQSGWGPAEGFTLADATTRVYLIADQAGDYTATIKLIQVDSNETLASADISISVATAAE